MPILTGTLRGWKWITGSATHGCWLGIYEREAQAVFRARIGKGAVVFDIGANVGFFTLLASKIAGPGGAVYSFEPLPRNVDYLRRHVAANHAANVLVLPVAVSARSGTARLGLASNPSMGRLADAGEVEVRCESLDELVGSGGLPLPDFVKIDVEGAELDVLHGGAALLQRHRPAMLLSTHGARMHEQCCALLREWGYALTVVRDGTVDGQYTALALRR